MAVSGRWSGEIWRWSRVRNVLHVALGSMSVTVLRMHVCVHACGLQAQVASLPQSLRARPSGALQSL